MHATVVPRTARGVPAAVPRTGRGFTLIEALVAIAVLALVALLAWRATAALSDGEARLGAESARWQQLDALLTRIEADLRTAVPRRARHGTTIEAAWSIAPEDAAGDTLLVFTRAGPDAIGEPGIGGQRIGYRLREGRVEALLWPRVDNPVSTDPVAYALADGVARFRVSALSPDRRWSDRWPFAGTSDIPRGVRVELVLADGSSVERWLALQ